MGVTEAIPVLLDSPEFRKALTNDAKECKSISKQLKSFVSAFKKYSEQLSVMAENTGAFRARLTQLSDIVDGCDSLFLDGFDHMKHQLELLSKVVDNSLVQPLEDFRKKEAKAAVHLRKEYEEGTHTFEQAMRRFLASKGEKSEDEAGVAESEIRRRKQQLDVQRFDVWSAQRSVQERKHMLMQTILLQTTTHHYEFFRMNFTFFEANKPAVDDLMNKITKTSNHHKAEAAARATTQAWLEQRLEEGVDDIESILSLCRLENALQQRRNSTSQNHDQSPVGVADDCFRGYLWLDETGRLHKHTWSKVWCETRSGQFSMSAPDKEGSFQPLTDMDLLLCSVQPAADTTIRFAFRIIDPRNRWLLQAESQTEMTSWLQALQASISFSLNGQTQPSHTTTEAQTSDVLQTLRARCTNTRCAECREPEATWCSLNLGVLLCLECSGIHRGLGVHVSKVRSTTLDTREFTPALVSLLCLLGNDNAAKVWEADVPDDFPRLDRDSPREHRERWVTAKYVERAFLPKTRPVVDPIAAAEEGDVVALSHFVAGGGDIDARGENGTTPLLAAAKSRHTETLAFILLSGAVSIDVCDNDGLSPLFVSARDGDCEAVDLLLRRGASLLPPADFESDASMEGVDWGGGGLHCYWASCPGEVVQLLRNEYEMRESLTPHSLSEDTRDDETVTDEKVRGGLRGGLNKLLRRTKSVNKSSSSLT